MWWQCQHFLLRTSASCADAIQQLLSQQSLLLFQHFGQPLCRGVKDAIRQLWAFLQNLLSAWRFRCELHRFLRPARSLLFYVNVLTAVGVVLLATVAAILNSLLLLLMELVFPSSTHIRWRFLTGVLIGATARPIRAGGRGR